MHVFSRLSYRGQAMGYAIRWSFCNFGMFNIITQQQCKVNILNLSLLFYGYIHIMAYQYPKQNSQAIPWH